MIEQSLKGQNGIDWWSTIQAHKKLLNVHVLQ